MTPEQRTLESLTNEVAAMHLRVDAAVKELNRAERDMADARLTLTTHQEILETENRRLRKAEEALALARERGNGGS